MTENFFGKKKILVGLSGGVDSFMAVHFLRLAGWEVVGVYLEMQKNSQKLEEAQASAKKLGIKLKVIDCQKEFQREIVDAFLKSYQVSQTPNPCVFCNPQIKFKFLLAEAKKNKIDYVATGHYAKVGLLRKYENTREKVKVKKIYVLKKGLDETKDQSYFLYRLQQRQLEKIVFPLGEKSKSEIKNEAKKLGFYEKKENKESQDVCFFAAEKGLAEFLEKNIQPSSGKIVDEKGKILGKHSGLEKYTLGQRKGIGISGGPFFVIEKKFKNNSLIVSRNKNHPLLWKKEIHFKKASWINQSPEEGRDYFFQVRYGNQGGQGKIKRDKKTKKWQIFLRKVQWAPAIGQSVVIFDGDEVVGGGVID